LKKSRSCFLIYKKIHGLSCDFDIFYDFSELFLYKKSHGSSLLITRPQLALDPWWTHDNGVARPLQGSGGCRDSSEREREEVVGVLTNGATWRQRFRDGHTMVLNKGGWWCSDGDMVPAVTT
jgi:hypothetical protein